MSHLNIYDTHDDIIESREDNSGTIGNNIDADEGSTETHDEPDDESNESHGLFDPSGSAEDLNRFELRSSEKLEKSSEEDEKENENPKPYTDNTHDYNEQNHDIIMAKHDCEIDRHMVKMHGAKPGSVSGDIKCPPTKAKIAKATTTKRGTVAVVTTAGPISTTIKKCSDGSDPNTDTILDDPHYHAPRSPLIEMNGKNRNRKRLYDGKSQEQAAGDRELNRNSLVSLLYPEVTNGPRQLIIPHPPWMYVNGKYQQVFPVNETHAKTTQNPIQANDDQPNRNRLFDSNSQEQGSGDGELNKDSLISLPYPEVTNGPGDLLALYIDVNGKYQQVFPVNETHAKTTQDPMQTNGNDDHQNRPKLQTIYIEKFTKPPNPT